VRALVYRHEAFESHDTGAWHPERPARLEAVLAGTRRSGVALIDRLAPRIEVEALYGVHDPAYVAAIQSFCAQGGGPLDADTMAVAGSWEAALRAAGAGPAAVGELRAGVADVGFLAVRPPGHHALSAQAMGFCLFNNIAVVARQLADAGERVAIFDWDVHHGNGTQDVFFDSEDVLYLSLHEFPAYPGSGWIDEHGHGRAAFTTVNFPFPAGTGGDVYAAALESVALPILRQFAPDWILVSAGYDAHRDDPLADIRLRAGDYARMSAELATIAPPGRLLFFLEGGYDLAALEASVAATLAGPAGTWGDEDELAAPPSSRSAWHILQLVTEAVSERWDVE